MSQAWQQVPFARQNSGANRMFIGPCIIAIVEELKTNLMSLVVFISLIFAQHVSNINMSIFRSLRLWWWIITSVILFSIRCVLGFAAGDAWWCPFCRLKHYYILMFETCWANISEIKTSDIKLVFNFSTIAMMHGPINNRLGLYIWRHYCFRKLNYCKCVYTVRRIGSSFSHKVSSLVWVALSYFLTSFESNTETLVAAIALLTHKDQLVLTGALLLSFLVGLTDRLVWSASNLPLREHYSKVVSLTHRPPLQPRK